jgi:hypothetical protein
LISNGQKTTLSYVKKTPESGTNSPETLGQLKIEAKRNLRFEAFQNAQPNSVPSKNTTTNRGHNYDRQSTEDSAEDEQEKSSETLVRIQ